MTKPTRSVYTDPEPVIVSIPAPEVLARWPTDAEFILAARRIVKLAVANGWQTRATYSRGHTLGANGKPTKVVDNLAVLCTRLTRTNDGASPSYERVVAVWVDGKFSSALTPNMLEGRLSSVALRERLSAHGTTEKAA